MGPAATMGMAAPTRGVAYISVGLNKCRQEVWSVVERYECELRVDGLCLMMNIIQGTLPGIMVLHGTMSWCPSRQGRVT